MPKAKTKERKGDVVDKAGNTAFELLVGVAEQEEKDLEEKTKVPVTQQDLIALAQEMLLSKQEADRLEAEAKQHKDRYNQLRTRDIPDKMRELKFVNSAGKGSFTFDGGKIHLETKVNASCAAANQPLLYAWLRKNKSGDLIKDVVHPSTLTAFVKERREQGLADPPGISVWEETKAKLTATK
jgi:hypothetical protein